MKDIAIFGAGGFGREVACLLRKINEHLRLQCLEPWNFIGFFDDSIPAGTQIDAFGKTLGGVSELNKWESSLAVAICIGTPSTLRLVRSKIVNQNIYFPNLIYPHFECSDPDTFKIGEGNIVTGRLSVTTNVKIGDFNIINGAVTIGHDVSIQNYNVIMCGVFIAGESYIGEENLLGTGCFIKQQIKVGRGVTISPLSAQLTNPKDNQVYIGNPAKKFKF